MNDISRGLQPNWIVARCSVAGVRPENFDAQAERTQKWELWTRRLVKPFTEQYSIVGIWRSTDPIVFVSHLRKVYDMIWTVLIGLCVGAVAKLISPGANRSSGFVITSVLGVLGAIGVSHLGEFMGFYREGDGEGSRMIAALLGAVSVLLICWGAFANRGGAP